MCGICGIVKFDNQFVEERKLKNMMQCMKHRGPDDEGVFIDRNTGFGFVRLSIIDLSSAGHQPMYDITGRYVIVFNGEIYNYIELREELIKKGNQFKTKTDTEVLLQAYLTWGEACLDRLNGMFAFVIYDKETKKLFGARDRFGVKPFYYKITEQEFIFASEIPPVLSATSKPTADLQSIFDYLAFNRTDQTERTFFQDIFKLQHGQCFSIQNGKIDIRKWYDLKSRVNTPFQNSDEYRDLLSSSIGLRLRSDVPVGVCLSGGLDSSAIVSLLLKDFNKNDIDTFSAVYNKGQEGDESEFINEFNPYLENMFYCTPGAESLHDELKNFIIAHAEPVPSTSPYAQYKVMQLAQGKVVVTLDGQGADEQLAGYSYFFGFYFKELFKRFQWQSLFREMKDYKKNHNSNYGFKTFAYFMLPKFIRTKLSVSERAFINKEFEKKYSKNNTIAGNLYASNSLNDSLVDHFEYKLEHLLKWSDRNSMFFSIESRAPFLDYRLVEKTLASPATMKIKNGTTKYILRDALKNILPEKIRQRHDKIGFSTPDNEWFRTEPLRLLITDIIQSESFCKRGICDPHSVNHLYHQHLAGKINISKDIWKWINLEIWFREFID